MSVTFCVKMPSRFPRSEVLSWIRSSNDKRINSFTTWTQKKGKKSLNKKSNNFVMHEHLCFEITFLSILRKHPNIGRRFRSNLEESWTYLDWRSPNRNIVNSNSSNFTNMEINWTELALINIREFKQGQWQRQRQHEKTMIWLVEWRKIIVLHVRHAL